jgi:DNA-binding NarL/FixJ family response regulator
METESIHIAIVDDHTLFRTGISSILKEFDQLEILFEAEHGMDMRQKLINVALPKVILMDINMPVMDGYDTTRWLKQNHPHIKVLALSMYDDDEAVIKMIKSGACGYILKKSKPRELLEAIKIVSEKGVFINEMVSGKMMRSLSSDSQAIKFSEREIDFLKLCCSELTYKEIADLMFVSPRTVDNYRESLFQKLELKTRCGLVIYAIKQKIYLLES